MSLAICSLNSGSNGNCYYISNGPDSVLIDAGISCRETEIRMKRSGLDIKTVKAVFISHEHSDHIGGLATLSKKHQLPVYITENTHKEARIRLEKHLIKRFSEDSPVQAGGLKITPFKKYHDAGDPYSFTVSSPSVTVGVFTDIGNVCKKLVHHFSQCHAAFLEANYDEDMLMNGDYPAYLKKRISDGNGHLSNDEALELFKKHRPVFMSHLILSHLSKNNNRPEMVRELFSKHAGSTEIIIASRYEESPVIHIGADLKIKPVPAQKKRKAGKQINPAQLSLFN